MELKVLIKKFLKFWPMLAALTILGGVVGIIFNNFQIPQYKTSILIYFAPSQNQVLAQSANEFTDTILGILASVDFGNHPRLEIRKVAPQLIKFTIFAPIKEEVLASGSKLPADLRVELEKVLGKEKISLTTLTRQLEIREPANLLLLNILVGAALGFALGTTISSTVIYFRM